MRRSKGIRQGTRNILRKRPRERGLIPITRALQQFEEGEKARIILEPSVHKGQPHRRFHNKTGVVVGKQGEAFMVKILDGKMEKKIIARPEHLRRVE